MQKIEVDPHGVARFKANAIVRHLLDNGPFDMNDLARMGFDDEDRRQFAQLIGYSVSGYGDLSYAEGHWTVAAADEEVGRIFDEAVALGNIIKAKHMKK